MSKPDNSKLLKISERNRKLYEGLSPELRKKWFPEIEGTEPTDSINKIPMVAKTPLVPCKTCNHSVSQLATACPNCGENWPGIMVKCPYCGSMSFTMAEKGFSMGSAAIGALLIGPVGLIGGMVGRKQIELVCINCGKRWMQ